MEFRVPGLAPLNPKPEDGRPQLGSQALDRLPQGIPRFAKMGSGASAPTAGPDSMVVPALAELTAEVGVLLWVGGSPKPLNP